MTGMKALEVRTNAELRAAILRLEECVAGLEKRNASFSTIPGRVFGRIKAPYAVDGPAAITTCGSVIIHAKNRKNF